MKRALFPLILIFLVFSLLPGVTASHLTAPPSSTPVVTPTPSTSVITWSQPTPLLAPVRVALNMEIVWALVVDPQSPDTIYVGTSGGARKSEDKGDTWRVITGLPTSEVPALAVDPRATDTLYASSWEWGVFKSTDGGATWQAVNEGLTNHKVQALALDPRAPDTVYAGTYGGGVFKSTNGGATWQAYNEGLATDTKVLTLTVDPQASGTIYIGTSEKGVFKSTDDGVTWPAANDGLTNREVWALAMDPHASDTVYAGTSGGVFKSTDGGATWQAANEGLTNLKVRALALDPQAPGTVYTGTREGGVFKSTDGGATWQAISQGLTSTVARLAVDPEMSGTIYAGTQGEGVFRSTDGSATWQALAADEIATNVVALAVDPQAPDTIYGGTSGGIFKSTDGGDTWQTANEGVTSRDVRALAVDPQAVGTVYAGTSGGVFKSSDGGIAWQEVNEGLTNRDVRALAVDPKSSGTVYVGTWQGGVFKSVDGAATWQEVNEALTNLDVWTLVLDPLSPTTVYVGTLGGGMFKSVDGAATWQAVNEGLTNFKVWALALDPQSPDTVYAGTGEALFKSVDSGLSWQHMFSSQFISLSVDPLISQAIYAATGASAVASVNLSRDGGVSWEKVGPPADASIRLLAINTSTPQTVYGVAGEKGVSRGQINRALLTSHLASSNDWVLPLVFLSLALLLFLTWTYVFVAWPNRIPFATALRLLLAPRQLVLAIGGGYVKRSWPQWQRSVESSILRQSRVTAQTLRDIPRPFRDYALQHYHQERQAEEDLSFEKDGLSLRPSARTRAWLEASEKAVDVLGGHDAQQRKEFQQQTAVLVQVLSDALGLVELESRSYMDIMYGYVVEAPALRLRVPPRFPVIFPQCTTYDEDDIVHLADFMGVLHMTDYFALLVAFELPERGQTATGLRQLVKDSPYAHDFIVLSNDDVLSILKAKDPNARLIQLLLDQVDLSLVSPYVTDGPVPENMYFGRETDIRNITQTIKANDFALAGGRKIGKTSTLQKIHRLLGKAPRYNTFYLDCQPITVYEEFFDVLGRKLNRKLDAAPVSFRDAVAWLRQEAGDRLVVVLLDEVDNLLTYDLEREEHLFKVFRSLSQEGYCRFVFCGGKALYKRIHHPDSPFFNFCKDIILGHLDEKSAAEIITRPMDDMGIELQDRDQLVAQIIKISACHPNLVQFICECLINRIKERRVTLEDLHAVTTSQEFYQYFIETIWGQSTSLEKIITLAMLDHHSFTRGEVYATLKESGVENKAAIEEALETLQLYTLLRQEGKTYLYALTEFPRIVRESEDVEALMESLLRRV